MTDYSAPERSAPRRLGSSYLLEALIGSGAQGEVWRGRRVDSQEPLAFKILRADLVDNPDVIDRFIKERSTLMRVRSPYVVAIRDVVIEGQTFAIAMDYVEDGDLRDLLRAEGTMTPAGLAAMGLRISQGLGAVHDAGVVHRDIKPANILLSGLPAPGDDGAAPAGPSGGTGVAISASAQTALTPQSLPAPDTVVPRVADFGVARICDAFTSAHLTGAIGTPLYMAPEILSAQAPTPAADIYSLGIMLYEMACGITPFVGEPARLLAQHARYEPGRPDGVPDALWELIASMLAKQPSSRPPIAYIIQRLEVLQTALAGLPAARRLPAPPVSTISTVPYDWDQASDAATPGAPAGASPTPVHGETLVGQTSSTLPQAPGVPGAPGASGVEAASVTPAAATPYSAYQQPHQGAAYQGAAYQGAAGYPGAPYQGAAPYPAGSGAQPTAAGVPGAPSGPGAPGSTAASAPGAPGVAAFAGHGAAGAGGYTPPGLAVEGQDGGGAPTRRKRRRRLWIPAAAALVVIAVVAAGVVWWRSWGTAEADNGWAVSLPTSGSVREDQRISNQSEARVSPTGAMYAMTTSEGLQLYDATGTSKKPVWTGDCDEHTFWNDETLLCQELGGDDILVGKDGKTRSIPGKMESFDMIGATPELAIVADTSDGGGSAPLRAFDSAGKEVWTVSGKYSTGSVANGFVLVYQASGNQIQVLSAKSGDVIASRGDVFSGTGSDKERPGADLFPTQRPGGFDISTGSEAFALVSKDSVTIYKADGTQFSTIKGNFSNVPPLATSEPLDAEALAEAYTAIAKSPGSNHAFGQGKSVELTVDTHGCTAKANGKDLALPELSSGQDCAITPVGVLRNNVLLVQFGLSTFSGSQGTTLLAISLEDGEPVWQYEGMLSYVLQPASGGSGGRAMLTQGSDDLVIISLVS
ncbi:serine/threonine-protein kinase [Actinomyces capricornis]|uniref:non-specific serine/threonine protein kinase n=1 Tax=Actinomyces capricornis TaxID=2755559 RepID=A0ABM7UP07_9ACTO|nr:serine/threonine-protein kinase [Actinomyces capricornis]BDA65097.1 hypothetical protein MANAM107_19310 [Actinomyces capricornis]